MTDADTADIPAGGHMVETRLHHEGAYDLGYFGHCLGCGWTGPLRDINRRGQALLDAYAHQQKESAA